MIVTDPVKSWALTILKIGFASGCKKGIVTGSRTC